ncbi:MAG: hypothetical protein L0Y61_00375 [Epsilonproteobacteria bacterium]|nr:hypothetical protein [Campylobacterota bacterium]
MKNKLLRGLVIAMFLMFVSFCSAQAEMKCAAGKCGGQMQEKNKVMKSDTNASCPTNSNSTKKMKQKCADGKCPTQAPEKK